jgi:DNA invertase Pin-like site-specific DNA recombinase
MPQIAYSLVRYSDPNQRKGASKGRQDGGAKEWCERNNARLDEDLSMLLDGESAFRGNHRKKKGRRLKPFAQFLADIESRRILPGSILIVENVDRLSREDIDDAWELLRGILRAGVDVVTLRPERRYTKKSLNNFAEILELKFGMYLAHEESAKKSERIGDAWARKKRRARETGEPVSESCPGWLVLGPDGYEFKPGAKETLRRILALTQEMGTHRLVRVLQEEGRPCFGRKGKWIPEYVRHLLRSPALYGAYQQRTRDAEGRPVPTGDPVPGYYPAACTEAEWRAANAAAAARYRTSGRPGEGEANLFTGILFEAESREPMHKKPCWQRGKHYEYLIAYRAERKVRVPYGPVEAGLVRALGGLREEDVLPPGQDADALLRRIGELSAEVLALGDRLKVLEAQQNDPGTDPDLLPSVQQGIVAVRRRQRERAKELRALEEEASTSRTKTLGACRSALSLLDTPERRRAAKARIRQLVESIWVRVQPVSRTCRIVHAHIYLRGGRRVYRQIIPPDLPPGTAVWQLGACDFRAGEVGDAARHPEPGAQLVG